MPLTGVPSPVAAPIVCVVDVSALVSGTMAVTTVVLTCSTGPVSVATGVVLPLASLPVDVLLPLSLDHVGELDAASDDVDCDPPPPPPSDTPVSPLPDVAHPASITTDVAARMHGTRRDARFVCGKTPRLGGLDFNKNAGLRILSLHNSERLLDPCLALSALRVCRRIVAMCRCCDDPSLLSRTTRLSAPRRSIDCRADVVSGS
jgi:hypothetical protein